MSVIRRGVRKIWRIIDKFVWSRGDFYRYKRHRALTLDIIRRRAAEDSADFVEANMAGAVLFNEREDMWPHVLSKLPDTGDIAEFGVFKGTSINFFARHLAACGDKRALHGFDSFEGLSEDWEGEALPAGAFDQKGRLPKVQPSVALYPGWVENTVPGFLERNPDVRIAMLHIDTDTYTPAKIILEHFKPRLVEGAIIMFDELIGYPNWRNHEYKALIETFNSEDYDFIGFTSRRAALKLKS